LAPRCYPHKEAKDNPLVTLEVPGSGGHVGFVSFGTRGRYWSEERTITFLGQGVDVPKV